jgi:hypothetical protein
MQKIVLNVNTRITLEAEDGMTPEEIAQTLDFNFWNTTDTVEVTEAEFDGFSVEGT